MVIIAKSTLVRFAAQHPDALVSLVEWYDTVAEVDWSNPADVRSTFNSVDYVGNDRFVFNIRGNRYRLIAAVLFSIRTVYIKFVVRTPSTTASTPKRLSTNHEPHQRNGIPSGV